jgi:hypothetical protein
MSQDRAQLIEQLVAEARQFWESWLRRLVAEGLSEPEAEKLLRTTLGTIHSRQAGEDTTVLEG